jgi:hypothetical protein
MRSLIATFGAMVVLGMVLIYITQMRLSHAAAPLS